jgi:hypothetical protein
MECRSGRETENLPTVILPAVMAKSAASNRKSEFNLIIEYLANPYALPAMTINPIVDRRRWRTTKNGFVALTANSFLSSLHWLGCVIGLNLPVEKSAS